MLHKFRLLHCKWLIVATLSLLVSAELAARFVLGLGNPPLYETAVGYGYRVKPNQNIRRFKHRAFYNAQGLRSEPISDKPLPGTIRILCIGDSITDPGAIVDQAKTYPYQLQDILNRNSSKHFEVLNASASGWALGNEAAYLRAHGIYHSQIVVLEHRTGNLFRNQNSGGMIGSPKYPNHKPLLALEDGFFRYFLPTYLPSLQLFQPVQSTQLNTSIQAEHSKENLNRNFAIFNNIAQVVKNQKAQLLVFLIEQPEEFEPKDALSVMGKKELAQRAKELSLPYINIAKDFKKNGEKQLFQDIIHPNVKGNTVIAKAIAKLIINSKYEQNK